MDEEELAKHSGLWKPTHTHTHTKSKHSNIREKRHFGIPIPLYGKHHQKPSALKGLDIILWEFQQQPKEESKKKSKTSTGNYRWKCRNKQKQIKSCFSFLAESMKRMSSS